MTNKEPNREQDCAMTYAYFFNGKKIYDRLYCGVIHGNGCDMTRCWANYDRIKSEISKEATDEQAD